jgi:hypothetical protein
VNLREVRPVGSAGDVAIAVLLPVAIALLGAALLILVNQFPTIGPFDRATVGWIVIPLMWLAPGIGGLWWTRLSARQTTTVWLTLAALITVGVAFTLVASGNRVGCDEVTRVEVALRGLLPGAVLGVGYATGARLSAATAWWLEARWGWVPAVILGGVIGASSFFAALFAWAWMFGAGVNCAPR